MNEWLLFLAVVILCAATLISGYRVGYRDGYRAGTGDTVRRYFRGVPVAKPLQQARPAGMAHYASDLDNGRPGPSTAPRDTVPPEDVR